MEPLTILTVAALMGAAGYGLTRLPKPPPADPMADDGLWRQAGFARDRSGWTRGPVRALPSEKGWTLWAPVPEGVHMGAAGAHPVAPGLALSVDDALQLGWWDTATLAHARLLDGRHARIEQGFLKVPAPTDRLRAVASALVGVSERLAMPPSLEALEVRCKENGPVTRAAALALQDLAPERLVGMVTHPDPSVRMLAGTVAEDWRAIIGVAGRHTVDADIQQTAMAGLLAACEDNPELEEALLAAPFSAALRAEGAMRTDRLEAMPELAELHGERDVVLRVLDRLAAEGRNIAAETVDLPSDPWWADVLTIWALENRRIDVLPPLHALRGDRERVRQALDFIGNVYTMTAALKQALWVDPWWALPLLEEPPDEERLEALRAVADEPDADPQAHAVVAHFLERWGTSEDVPRLRGLAVSDIEQRVENLKTRLVGSVGAVSVVEGGAGDLSLVEED